MLRVSLSHYAKKDPLLSKKYHKLSTPIVLIGYGSIGRGVLPLMRRHFDFKKEQLSVIDPDTSRFSEIKRDGFKKVLGVGLTKDNFVSVLDDVFSKSKGGDAVDQSIRGVIMNASVDTSSLDIMDYAQKNNLLYIDTVVEPWKGKYYDKSLTTAERSNYALREELMSYARQGQGKGLSTCVSCAGANPGMVSWFIKDALLLLRKDLGLPDGPTPKTRQEWATLMRLCGVKGVHIAERDTQCSKLVRPYNAFWNTWSVEGFLSEGFQPAELGWGSHEKWFPENAKRHTFGSKAAIYLEQPGANTRVRTWCPTLGAQYGFLVTHNEAITIADYYSVGSGDSPEYRPTVHYAYQPCRDAVMSLFECFGHGDIHQPVQKVLSEKEIVEGHDELGVLLYGHKKNALWLGSTLSNKQCRKLCDRQNATGMQVTTAMIAALNYALNHPREGIIGADDMDFEECLRVQKPYLGKYWWQYTDWTPLQSLLPSDGNTTMFKPPPRTDLNDPWQFSNVLV